MLHSLYIQNYALIEKLDIDFERVSPSSPARRERENLSYSAP
jgi:hypothetical protein